MHSKKYLARQKRRIEERIKRCENVVRGRRLDASLKAEKVLPSQRMALSLLKSGKYGICIACGESISPERLEFVPAALRCVPCQTDAEK